MVFELSIVNRKERTKQAGTGLPSGQGQQKYKTLEPIARGIFWDSSQIENELMLCVNTICQTSKSLPPAVRAAIPDPPRQA